MNNNLHPTFQQILNNALKTQIEREKGKPKQEFSPQRYLELHESEEELHVKHSDYGIRGWF